MKLVIRSGAPARTAPEAGDADPTHCSSDCQAFPQAEIGGLRAHGMWDRVRIREPCAHPHPFAHTEMMILLYFTTFLKDFGKPLAGKTTVSGRFLRNA